MENSWLKNKNAQNEPFGRVWESQNSVARRVTFNSPIEKFKSDILSHFPTLCRISELPQYQPFFWGK